jgi:hypothetical protein
MIECKCVRQRTTKKYLLKNWQKVKDEVQDEDEDGGDSKTCETFT